LVVELDGSGEWTLDGSASILTNAGTLTVLNGGAATVTGTLKNTGSFTLNSTGSTTDMRISGNATLTGPNAFVLSDNPNNRILGASTGTETLTNQGTIQGAGQIGAGFIGCIILEALANRGVSLTVVEMGDRMVPRMMGQGAGGMIKRWVQSKGIQVYTSTRVEAIERDASGALAVRLSSGERVAADLVISATGVKPNIEFLAGAGIECGQGVLTDAQLQTNVAGIYAAGDCAEAFDLMLGRQVVSAIQPNAADQALCAAMNMIGRRSTLKCVTQINVLDTLGLVSSSFGNWEGVTGGDHVERQDDQNHRFIRLEFDGDVLVGANTIGLTERVGLLRGLIQSRTPLGHWKHRLLADPLALGEAYLSCAQAQSSWGLKAA